MAELVFFLVLIAGAFALAMNRAPLLAWAAALAAAVLVWQTGLLWGEFAEPDPGALGLLAWVPVVVLAGLSITPLRRVALTAPVYRKIKGILPKVSATEKE
ncbi:MAG TPA: acyl-CoA dehydrogenase, partial [Hyphomicrobiaceae bacterium]|nr:acyl-CoA dehydrogenase [Hyphomicrobiaceae bacterium]